MNKQFEYIKWALFIAVALILWRVLSKFGVIGVKSEEEKQEDEATSINLNIEFKEWTNPNFYRKKAPKGYVVPLIPVTGADYIAKRVYDSHGIFNDDEEMMQGALKLIRYRSQYSWIADRFNTLYRADLTSWLKNYYSENELYPVWRYLENLPIYKKA